MERSITYHSGFYMPNVKSLFHIALYARYHQNEASENHVLWCPFFQLLRRRHVRKSSPQGREWTACISDLCIKVDTGLFYFLKHFCLWKTLLKTTPYAQLNTNAQFTETC